MVKQVTASAQITLTDLGDAIISGTKPTNPKLDQLWIERLTGKPDKLWRWNGTSWIEQTLDLGSLDPDADGKIENHETTIGNMVNDAKVDITERQEVKNKLIPIIGQAVADNLTSLPTAAQLWTNGVGEVFTVRKAAQNVGIQTTEAVYVAVETAYNSLQTYLNGMTPKPWDASVANKDNAITVVPTDWRTKWLDYYKAVQALTVAVQTKLQGNIDNIKIGTSNILDYSGNFTDTTNWVLNSGTSIAVVNKDGFNVIKGVGSYMQTANKTKLKPDTEYVYSGEIMFEQDLPINDSTPLHCWIANGGVFHSVTKTVVSKDKIAKANVWTRIVISFKTLATGETTFTPIIYTGSTMNTDEVVSYLKNIQLEEGNTPSSWKPSVNDVNRIIADADAKAQKVTDSVNDMSLDSKLTPVEKIQLKTDYESIAAEFSATLASADTFNLTSSSERVAYNAAYGSLKTFVDPLLAKMNETSGVDRNVFRQRFKDYYDTKAKLLKKISDTSKGLIDGINVNSRNLLLRTIDYTLDGTWRWQATNVLNEYYRGTKIAESPSDWASMDYVFSTLGTRGVVKVGDEVTMSISARLVGDDKETRELKFYHDGNPKSDTTVGTVTKDWQRFSITMKVVDTMLKDTYTARFEVYQINNTPIKLQTAEYTLNIGNKDSGWTPAVEDINQMISNVDTKAEESKSAISDMSSDSKLTPLEKVQLKKEWGTIAAEKPQYETLGKSYYNASTELNAYINAYNTLNNTLNGTNGYLKNMTSTDDINATTFRAQFDTYYAKQAELIKKVNNLIQGNIDGIQGVKNLILASKREINSNDYLLNDYTITEDFVAGQDYTFVVKGTVPAGQKFGIWQNGGFSSVGYAEAEFIKGVYYVTFKAVATTAGNARYLQLYNYPSNTTNSTVEWVALYKGTKPFDWTAAPEDADVGKTNLIVDSEFKYLTSWLRANPNNTVIESGIMPNGVKNIRTTIATTGYYDFAQYIEVEPNTEYTFSCNAGGNFQIFLWEKKADKTATNVYKDNAKSFNFPYDMSSPRSTFTYTIKTQPDAKYIHFIFRVTWSGGGTTGARIALPQLERGTTASEWKANPFDTSNGEIFIQGSGADQTDKRRILSVNGKDVYVESVGRGLRLVTLKRTSLEVVENILYDVYGTETARNDLATKLNSLGDDVFITLTSYDAIQWNTNLRNAMIAIGGSGADATFRMPYAFIGMKGLGRYNGLEQYTGTTALFGVAQISAKVKNGMLEGVNNNTGASDNIIRQDLRITAPLPTSISLDSNGITASTTTAGKYARLDYRGLFIAGGALQIEGGLTEQQLASGVTKKMSYLDSNGLYTGQVNIGGSGTNGILSIKNASNTEIVRGDTNGLYVKNGALTIERPDGAKFISNGITNFDFTVTSHEPYFRAIKVEQNGWWWQTKSSGGISDQSCNYYSFRKVGRYLKFRLGFFSGGGAGGVIIYAGDGKTILWSKGFEHTNSQHEEEVSIDLGVPNYGLSSVYLALNSYSLGYMYLRNLRCWIEG